MARIKGEDPFIDQRWNMFPKPTIYYIDQPWKSRGIISCLQRKVVCKMYSLPSIQSICKRRCSLFESVLSKQLHRVLIETIHPRKCMYAYRIPEVHGSMESVYPGRLSYPKKGKAKHRERVHMFGASGR